MYRVLVALLLLGAFRVGWDGPAARAQAESAVDGVHPLIGSWLVEVEVDGEAPLRLPNLASFTGDGIVLVAAPALLPELPGAGATRDLFSSGHGAWRETGADSADVRFVFLVVDEQGRPASMNIVDGALRVDAGGDAYAGEFTLSIEAAEGESPAPATGTWSATRIAPDSEMTTVPVGQGAEATPAEPAGTPAA